MSTISTRKQVQQVESAPLAGAALSGATALGAGLAMLLGAGARALYRGLTATTEASPRPATVGVLRPAAPVLAAGSHAPAGLPPLEREKLEALVEVAGTALSPAHAQRVESEARAVLDAGTLREVRAGRLRLEAALTDSHRGVLAQSLALCCRRAALQLGFTPLVEEFGAAAPGGLPLRVAATDQAGRAIISEIRLESDGAITLESESAGITDGSCGELMTRYEALLEEQGVRSQAPRRRRTGGMVVMQAARRFLGSRLRPPATRHSDPGVPVARRPTRVAPVAQKTK